MLQVSLCSAAVTQVHTRHSPHKRAHTHTHGPQEDYSDGVPLRVEMHLDQDCPSTGASGGTGGGTDPLSNFVPFQGAGNVLATATAGGGGGPREPLLPRSARRPGPAAEEVWRPAAGCGGPQGTAAALFRRLPVSVIRNGEVVPVKVRRGKDRE